MKPEELRAEECGCYRCVQESGRKIGAFPETMCRMILCETCGNKRCPHGTDHRLDCTNSNALDQPGSRYALLSLPSKAPTHDH